MLETPDLYAIFLLVKAINNVREFCAREGIQWEVKPTKSLVFSLKGQCKSQALEEIQKKHELPLDWEQDAVQPIALAGAQREMANISSPSGKLMLCTAYSVEEKQACQEAVKGMS